MPKQRVPIAVKETSKQMASAFHLYVSSGSDVETRPNQGRLLCYLSKHPDASAAEMQQWMVLSKATLSEMLSALVSDGLIAYETSPEDRREKVAILTEKGANCVKKIRQRIEEFEEMIMSGLDENEIKALENGLEKIRYNAERILHERSGD